MSEGATLRETRTADLDVLPEIPRTTIPVVVTWPLCAVHGDGAGKVERLEWVFRQVLDTVDIFLSNFSRLMAVISITSYKSLSDGKEDEPVARR
jgi:hypothetical protein